MYLLFHCCNTSNLCKFCLQVVPSFIVALILYFWSERKPHIWFRCRSASSLLRSCKDKEGPCFAGTNWYRYVCHLAWVIYMSQYFLSTSASSCQWVHHDWARYNGQPLADVRNSHWHKLKNILRTPSPAPFKFGPGFKCCMHILDSETTFGRHSDCFL
jgi:hypothetical protein